MLNHHINPAHPVLVAFSMSDQTTSLLGGVPRITDAISADLYALFKGRGGTDCVPIFVEGGYIFNLRFPLLGAPDPWARINVIFSPVLPFWERREWVIHLVSTPPYADLSLEDRIILLDLQRDIAGLLVDNPVTEEVDASQVD